MNTLRPSYSVDDSGRFTAFSVLQSAAPSHPTLRSHRIAIGLYSLADGALTRVHLVETDVTGDCTPVPELVGLPRPDLVLINDDDLTYAKIRLDPHSLDTAVTSVGSFTSSLPAALVWAASWDMVRDGEMAARDYARLVAGGVDSVRDISVVQTLLRQATLAVRQYADPSWRAEGLALLASALRSLLQAAPAGSDHQLAYVRAFTSVATSAQDLEFLAGLLDGAVALDGLAVDTDLRWALLRRLVSRGVRGEDAIDAELSRDATDAGERQAAGCRAAIPTVAAKRETWEALTDGKLTIAMFRADHRQLRRPRPARVRRAVPRRVLRRARRGVGGVVLGDGAGLRGVRLHDLRGRRDDDRGHGRVPVRRVTPGAAPAAHRGPRRGWPRAAQPGPRPRSRRIACRTADGGRLGTPGCT